MILPPVADILIYTWKRKGKSMTAGQAARRQGLPEESWRKAAAILRLSDLPLHSVLKKINILILIKRFSDPWRWAAQPALRFWEQDGRDRWPTLQQKQPLLGFTVFSYSSGETHAMLYIDFSFVCQRHSLCIRTNPLIPTGKRTKIICFQWALNENPVCLIRWLL